MTSREKRITKTNLLGYLLVLPMVVGFIVFSFVPLVESIKGSFYDMYGFYWDTSSEYFIGVNNYKTLFSDLAFRKSIVNTLYLMLGIPIGMVVAFFLATLINSKYSRLKKPYLIIYYLPAVSSAVAIGLVWKWLFNSDYGVVNKILGTNIHWLTSPSLIKTTLVMKGVWGGTGGTLLLYYAALQNIPTDLYEAADIAGANSIQKMFKITIPLVSGTTFYVFVTGVIGGLLAFADNYVVASGSEANTIVYFLYDKMKHGEYGLVTAGSVIVFVAIFLVTLLQFYLNFRGKRAVRR